MSQLLQKADSKSADEDNENDGRIDSCRLILDQSDNLNENNGSSTYKHLKSPRGVKYL